MSKVKNKFYYLYILKCSDDTFYTGITTNILRRVEEHNTGKGGAKYTRVRRPVKVVYSKRFKDRSKASIAEAHMKNLSRAEKLALVDASC